MKNDFIAKSEISINAPVGTVWDAFTNPETIEKYMFGTKVISDWQTGSKITWQGEWKGKHYEDKGTILQIIPNEILQYTHFSPSTGLPDIAENYHTVTIRFSTMGNQTLILLTQNNNATDQARQHSENNWNMMLSGLKKMLELPRS
ncbi:MAG: SRPBCC domain-containing protein [Bacteroidetes bacterium]|nr:SRPBCC domain-containing protein [Bacteroidota bacterium]